MDGPDYRVGRFTLKPFRQLLDGGVPMPIGRKALDLLSLLAKAEGALVTKDELMAAIWPKSIVEENVIHVHIAALRKALGKDAVLLSTVHGLGYRLTALPATSFADLKSESPEARRAAEVAIAHAGEKQAANPERDVPPDEAKQADNAAGGTRPAPAPAQGWKIPLAALAAALIVAVAMVSHWRISSGAGVVSTAVPRQAAPAAPAVNPAPITIAVLPFDNLSGDAPQQFFADGLTEEISASLAKVPGLVLIARASAFQFRGDKDVRHVGSVLGARFVIEGAVRRSQNRVRITAQLIRTDSGVSVWSENYERELTDVFVIQENIATAIAEALKAPLGLPPGARQLSNRSIDPQSYEQFLRAKPLVRARLTGVPQAIKILDVLVKRNPDYAPAWALLASCYSMLPVFLSPYNVSERHRRIRTFWPRAELAANRAMLLDPDLPDAYSSLARLEMVRGRLIASQDLLSKALALDPNNPDTLGLQVNLFSNVGWQKKAAAMGQRLLALDPYMPTWKQDTAEVFWENGQSDMAIEMLKSLINRQSGATSLAMMYASVGRYADAADVLETARKVPNSHSPEWPSMFRLAEDLLRQAPANVNLPPPPPRLDRVGFAYLYVGASEHALDTYEDTLKSGLVGGQGGQFGFLWHASYAPVRKTERFKMFVRKAGFVDYWRQYGWPDRCRPIGADDFVCE
jgi:TolB-like protein/DNA-binding winged helix-turn-helix (wHTH) protein